MTIEVRKTDTKGRLTVGEDGKLYAMSKDEATGVITLYPVKLPKIQKLPHGEMRGIFIRPGVFGASPATTVVIYSAFGARDLAALISPIADLLQIPVVIESAGVQAHVADEFQQLQDAGSLHQEIVKVMHFEEAVAPAPTAPPADKVAWRPADPETAEKLRELQERAAQRPTEAPTDYHVAPSQIATGDTEEDAVRKFMTGGSL